MKRKTKIVLLSTIIVTTILLIVSLIYKPCYPIKAMDKYKTLIGDINSDSLIVQKFESKLDTLDSISIFYGNYGKKVEKGTMDVRIYNYDNELLYKDSFALKKYKDNSKIKFEFDMQKKTKGKLYTLELEFKDLDTEQPITFYAANQGKELTAYSSNDIHGIMVVDQYGQVRGDYYSILLGIVLVVLSAVFMFKWYKNGGSTIKHKKLNNIFIAVVSLVFTICFLDCKMDMNRYYSVSWITFIILLITGLIIIRNIIISLENKNMEDIFLALAIPLGTMFFIAIVPGAVPDEPYHYNAVIQMAKGNILLDKFKFRQFSPSIARYDLVIQALTSESVIPFKYIGVDRVGAYPQILYVPAAIGVFIAQLFGLTTMASMYVGCYFNFIMFLVLGYYTIKYLPFGKIIGLVYLLNPMNLQQVTSLSCDAMIHSVCLFFIAYVLYLKFKKDELSLKNGAILAVLMVIVFVSKFAYFPLFLLLFLLKDKMIIKKKINKKIIIPIALALIMCIASYMYFKVINVSHVVEYTKNTAVIHNKYTKSQYLLDNPLNIIYLGLNTMDEYLDFYITSFAGKSLGLLNLIMPDYLIYGYLALLALSIFIKSDDTASLTKKQKILTVLTWMFGIIVVLGGLYFGFGSVRELSIGGVQGRYFVPVNLLLLLAIYNRKRYLNINKGLTLIAVGLFIINLLIISNVIDWLLI